MKGHTKIDLSNGGTGFGPVAWDRDSQKMSMHPPVPGHIEFVEKAMNAHHNHHIAKRRHPEDDNETTLIQTEIKAESMAHGKHIRKIRILRRWHQDKKRNKTHPRTRYD
jgi:hypothetical protein